MCGKGLSCSVVVFFLVTLLVGLPFADSEVYAIEVYNNDFSAGAVGSEWTVSGAASSPVGVAVAPNGEEYLGDIYAANLGGPIDVTLSLNGLTNHSDATVSLSLYLFGSWDGNSNYCCGPEIWALSADGGLPFLNTTFSNTGSVNHQAYPGTYPGSDNPAGTGAALTDLQGALGYVHTHPDPTWYSAAIYDLRFTFAHTSDDLTFSIHVYGDGLQPGSIDEWFGIDNVKIEVTPAAVPEPSTFLLLGAGIVGLLGFRRLFF